MDAETALNDVGTFGLWHLWIYTWIFGFTVFNAFLGVGIVFMNEIPAFACGNELSHSGTWKFADVQKASCPRNEDGTLNCCMQFKRNYTDLLTTTNYSSFMDLNETAVLDTERCPGSFVWHYTAMEYTPVSQGRLVPKSRVVTLTSVMARHCEFSDFHSFCCLKESAEKLLNFHTIAQIIHGDIKWSLVCDRSMDIASMQLVFMVGFLVSCCSFGFLADRFGRRMTLCIVVTLSGIVGVVNSLVPNFYAFLVLRFFLGVFSSAGSNLLYILGLELTNYRLRKIIGAIFFVFWSLGYVLLCGIAYAVRDWRVMHIIGAAPSVMGFILLWVLPESPRWLISQKRYADAAKTLNWGRRWNGKPEIKSFEYENNGKLLEVPNVTLKTNGLKPENMKKTWLQDNNFLTVFLVPRLTGRAIILFFCWMVNAMVYYGISLLITSFSGDIFVNNAISGAVEAPAYILCYPMLLWARKKSLMAALIAAGVSGILYLAVPNDVGWAQLMLAFIGKLCITGSFNLLFVVTLELYPTSMRGSAMLVSSMMGRIGSIVAPYITLIAQTNKQLVAVPMVIFGAAALLAGLLAFFLPETQGRPLPERLEDVLHFPRKKHFCKR